MKRVLLDTNIILDLLAAREPFLNETRKLFSLGEQGKIELVTSALNIANTHYILSRQLKPAEVAEILEKLLLLVKVLPLNEKIIRSALVSEFKDFEDAIQYYTALENGADVIITRNIKDFKKSKLPVMTAKDFILLV